MAVGGGAPGGRRPPQTGMRAFADDGHFREQVIRAGPVQGPRCAAATAELALAEEDFSQLTTARSTRPQAVREHEKVDPGDPGLADRHVGGFRRGLPLRARCRAERAQAGVSARLPAGARHSAWQRFEVLAEAAPDDAPKLDDAPAAGRQVPHGRAVQGLDLLLPGDPATAGGCCPTAEAGPAEDWPLVGRTRTCHRVVDVGQQPLVCPRSLLWVWRVDRAARVLLPGGPPPPGSRRSSTVASRPTTTRATSMRTAAASGITSRRRHWSLLTQTHSTEVVSLTAAPDWPRGHGAGG